MDNDDKPVGKILSRRQALRLFGIASSTIVGSGIIGKEALAQGGAGGTSAGTSGVSGLPGCVVRPAMTEGPYFVDGKLNRSDIRSDTTTKKVVQGVPLTLTFLVSKVAVGSCQPRSGVMVDVWHCDTQGVYSDASDPSFNTRGQNFLRGYQITDAAGKATFKTIYPGWYRGRAVHIHFKLRTLQDGKVTGDFTSQLFFDENISALVLATAKYKPKGSGYISNSSDGIYRNGGSQMLLDLKGNPTEGYTTVFDVGLNIA